jgi:hypothetical protein
MSKRSARRQINYRKAPGRGRAVFSVLAVAVLFATAVMSGWLLLGSSVFAGGAAQLAGPLPAAAADAPLEVGEGARVLFNAQLSQPRDPFRPLIDENSPAGTPGLGTPGFTPGTTTVVLVEITEVDGVPRAIITVNGTTYDVGVGDTFAGVYQVVSISPDTVVLLFGDNAFTLSVGQQILK